jgi:hypothetical protein
MTKPQKTKTVTNMAVGKNVSDEITNITSSVLSEKELLNLRNRISKSLDLPKTISLQTGITMFFLKTATFTNEYDEFVKHYNNRDINKNHIKTLQEILKEEDGLQIWYPILVVENKVGLTEDDIKDIKRSMKKGVAIDQDKYKKKSRQGAHIPKYIIIDGQHRFDSFRSQDKEIVYCDLTLLYGERVNDPEFIKDLVDKFNIGSKSYTKGQIRVTRGTKNSFLKTVIEESRKVNIRISKDKNVRHEYDKHASKGSQVVTFDKAISKSWIEKALLDIAAEHTKSNYMSKSVISNADKVKIRKSIAYSKCFIDGLDGHFPPQTTEAYAWVRRMVKYVLNTAVDVEYYSKLSKFLVNERSRRLYGNSIMTKTDLKHAVEIYSDKTLISRFLKENYNFNIIVNNANDSDSNYYELLSIKGQKQVIVKPDPAAIEEAEALLLTEKYLKINSKKSKVNS